MQHAATMEQIWLKFEIEISYVLDSHIIDPYITFYSWIIHDYLVLSVGGATNNS